MRRRPFGTVLFALAIAAGSLAWQSRPSAQIAAAPDTAAPGWGVRFAAMAPADIRTWDRVIDASERDGGLRVIATDVDPLVPGREVQRLQQFHQGVPVWGAEVVRDDARGVTQSLFGALAASPALEALDTTPTLSEDDASETLRRLGGGDLPLRRAAQLVVLPLDGGDARLAWTAVAGAVPQVDRIFIDAHTGAELLRYTEIERQSAAVGTGTGVLGDQKKLSVEQGTSGYTAFDRHRPPVIETFDFRNNLTRAKLLLDRQLAYATSDLATDSDNIWTDPAVVDAHVHVSWTYDFYYKRFGRLGLDDRNGPINVGVNAVSQQGALTISSADRADYALNAWFCGSCGPQGQGIMFFGNGVPSTVTVGGATITYFAGSLDVAAHELTHGVTAATSRLIYNRESGALNEAFSDIMGKSVEFFYHLPGSNPGQADYTLGKDTVRGARAGVLNGDRSMANPALYGDPDHYSHRYLGTADNGGVHTNSGIANHAFYLAIEGGTNRTSGLAVDGVGGANREQIEKVFYRAFTLLMPANSTFATARAATIQAARDLYGAGSAAERAVTQAWTAVGVQ